MKSRSCDTILLLISSVVLFKEHKCRQLLTSDADRRLPALGGPQVAPRHTLAPIVFWPMKIFHLLSRHVDENLSDFQSCRDRHGR